VTLKLRGVGGGGVDGCFSLGKQSSGSIVGVTVGGGEIYLLVNFQLVNKLNNSFSQFPLWILDIRLLVYSKIILFLFSLLL
jgi:hypothetical protein